MNKLLGRCEVYAGNTDSCKYRMSCCENTHGDMLCVRANRIKRRHRQAMRESQRVGVEPAVPAASSVAAVAVPPPKEEVIEMLNGERKIIFNRYSSVLKNISHSKNILSDDCVNGDKLPH